MEVSYKNGKQQNLTMKSYSPQQSRRIVKLRSSNLCITIKHTRRFTSSRLRFYIALARADINNKVNRNQFMVSVQVLQIDHSQNKINNTFAHYN